MRYMLRILFNCIRKGHDRICIIAAARHISTGKTIEICDSSRWRGNAPIQGNFGILACPHCGLVLAFDDGGHHLLIYRE